MPVPCARCTLPLARFEYEAGGTATCTPCGARNTVRVFPALLAPSASARAEAAMDGEAACFEHPAKRAVAACGHCGRYVCSLCSVDFGNGIWCPACVAGRSGEAREANLEPSRTLYDSMVLILPLASLAAWPFTALTAPAALVLGVARWNRPLSLVRRSRWRFVVGMAIALAEVIGWVWGTVYLLARMGTVKS